MERELLPVEREVVNPAHRVLSPTVNHLHKVLRAKDGELLSVEREKKINKTISYKWLLNIPLSSNRKTPHVIKRD